MRTGWAERPIAALATYENGYPFKPEDLSDTGVPIVRIRQLNDPSADMDHFDGDVGDRYRLRNGDLVFSWSGTLRAVIWNRGDAFLNQHLFRVDPARGVDRQWLVYVLNWSIQHFDAYMHGSAMTHITKPMMKDVRAPVPPLREQRAIADFLDRETARIDTLIEEQKRLIEMLHERRLAVAERALVALDWVTPLRAGATLIQTGPFGSQLKSDEYEPGGTPVINPSHLISGEIVPDSDVAVTATKAVELSRHALQQGDIVVARRGELGRCAVARHEQAGYLCGTGSAIVRPDPERLDPHFGALAFGSRRTRDVLRLESVGSTMDNLNAGILAALRVPLPPLTEQRRVVAFVREQAVAIDRLIAEAERFIELSRERRSALITAAVTGQIDVREEVA